MKENRQMTKFKLRKDLSIQYAGRTLYRIEALEDIPGLANKGDIGGYVEKKSNLQGRAWIGNDAKVFGYAIVFGHAKVYGHEVVCGNSVVYGNKRAHGHKVVFGHIITRD